MTELLTDMTTFCLIIEQYLEFLHEFRGTDQIHSLQVKRNTHKHEHASLAINSNNSVETTKFEITFSVERLEHRLSFERQK